MSYRPNAAQRALQEPGDCTRCGKPSPAGRNTAGHCHACHNAEYFARREREREAAAAQKSAAADYWRQRGIAPGATVVCFTPSLLPGLMPGGRYVGKAKCGSNGPYVHVRGFKQHFSPDQFAPLV